MKLKKGKNDIINMTIDTFYENMDEDFDSDNETTSADKQIKVSKVKSTDNVIRVKKLKKKRPIKENSVIAEKEMETTNETNTKIKVNKKKKKSNGVQKSSDGEKATEALSKTKKKSKVKKEHEVEIKEESDDESEPDETALQEGLKKLKDIDPEFYTFLEKNDKKLLNFNVEEGDDSEVEEKSEEKNDEFKKGKKKKELDSDDEENNDDNVHRPNEDLEIASDDSDFIPSGEEDDDIDINELKPGQQIKVTIKLLKQWELDLTAEKIKLDTLQNIMLAFNSALSSISSDDEELKKHALYKVEGSAAFNGIIQLCVLYLQTATYNFLGIKNKNLLKNVHKTKRWIKIRTSLRNYFIDLTKLLENITSQNILQVLLKHLHKMSPVLTSFTTIAKPILKRLIVLWSTNEDTIRVLSFLCILKITRNQQQLLLSIVLKAMYLSYVRNSKFVSNETLPAINFMKRSLTEMFGLDLNVTYQHAFLYIRQLAIHLRNALTLNKKESYQTVYNWQYVNSLRLWGELLATTYNRPQLQPLIYPLVNIITGVIKLIPTAVYFPLRFHCVDVLIKIIRETDIFIPVLPYILEVLNSETFNKKYSKSSMKPMYFTCILRCSKSDIQQNVYRDEIVENIYSLLLEYMTILSYNIAYPELSVLAVVHLKKYIKKSKNVNYKNKLRQLMEKIVENSTFVTNERNKIQFELKDQQMIGAWETKIKNGGTPLLTFYNNWLKTNVLKKKRQAGNTDVINKYDLPVIVKRKRDGKIKKDGPVELFPDSDDDDEVDRKIKMELENSDEEDYDDDDDEPKKKKHKNNVDRKPIVEQENDSNDDDDEDNEDPDDAGDDDDDYVDSKIDIVKDLDLDVDWN